MLRAAKVGEKHHGLARQRAGRATESLSAGSLSAGARKADATTFHEIYIKADLATCEGRDPKGLYQKARSGEIAEFTGISAPYEPPLAPELVVDTQKLTIADAVASIVAYVEGRFRRAG